MKPRELAIAAADRLNEMVGAAYDSMEVGPATTYDSPFAAVISGGWEAIQFLGETRVWCPETDQCDTPDDGETIESIVRYVWEDELRDLVTLLVAFRKQCESVETGR